MKLQNCNLTYENHPIKTPHQVKAVINECAKKVSKTSKDKNLYAECSKFANDLRKCRNK